MVSETFPRWQKLQILIVERERERVEEQREGEIKGEYCERELQTTAPRRREWENYAPRGGKSSVASVHPSKIGAAP